MQSIMPSKNKYSKDIAKTVRALRNIIQERVETTGSLKKPFLHFCGKHKHGYFNIDNFASGLEALGFDLSDKDLPNLVDFKL